MSIALYMTSPVHTIDAHDSLEDADEQMKAAHVRHLPVVERGRVIGMLTERDILRSLAGKRLQPDIIAACHAMSPAPYTVTLDTPLEVVAGEMARRGYGAAIVVDDGGEVAGIFTSNDALRLVGNHPDQAASRSRT